MKIFRYWQKTRKYNRAWLDLEVTFGDYSSYMGENVTESMQGLGITPTAKVRIEMWSDGHSYVIDEWYLAPIDKSGWPSLSVGWVEVYLDNIVKALDLYIYDHEGEITSSNNIKAVASGTAG